MIFILVFITRYTFLVYALSSLKKIQLIQLLTYNLIEKGVLSGKGKHLRHLLFGLALEIQRVYFSDNPHQNMRKFNGTFPPVFIFHAVFFNPILILLKNFLVEFFPIAAKQSRSSPHWISISRVDKTCSIFKSRNSST